MPRVAGGQLGEGLDVAAKLDGMRLAAAASGCRDGVAGDGTYTRFPMRHWRRIRTNNAIERLNREIRRRTRVVGTFPDGNSAHAGDGQAQVRGRQRVGIEAVSGRVAAGRVTMPTAGSRLLEFAQESGQYRALIRFWTDRRLRQSLPPKAESTNYQKGTRFHAESRIKGQPHAPFFANVLLARSHTERSRAFARVGLEAARGRRGRFPFLESCISRGLVFFEIRGDARAPYFSFDCADSPYRS